MNPNLERKAGYQKIKFCGERATIDGLKYIWVDTCCIDKQSSAELSEAINSMFRWYKNAEICYVYLSDVSAAEPPHSIYPTVSTLRKVDGLREDGRYKNSLRLQRLCSLIGTGTRLERKMV
jgi:hypothetical protein